MQASHYGDCDETDDDVEKNVVVFKKVEILSTASWSDSCTSSVDAESIDSYQQEPTIVCSVDAYSTTVDISECIQSEPVEPLRLEFSKASIVTPSQVPAPLVVEEAPATRVESLRKQSEARVSPPNSEEAAALRSERWSDALASPPDDETIPSDAEPAPEMYFTASSEVSLVSDTEGGAEDGPERKEGVTAGHVAAMRERFESMTRSNTPCPDLLDVFRTVTPSPDRLG